MMSDTPETDAKLVEGGAAYLEIVSADFARSLERRLQAAEKERDAVRRALRESPVLNTGIQYHQWLDNHKAAIDAAMEPDHER